MYILLILLILPGIELLLTLALAVFIDTGFASLRGQLGGETGRLSQHSDLSEYLHPPRRGPRLRD